MRAMQRPLANLSVSLSISESNDTVGRGFPTWQVNRLTLQIVAALFGQGANILFGHDWRDDGVMEAVHGFAQQVQAPLPLNQKEAQLAAQPLLRNCLAWPDVPFLSPEEQERLNTTLRIETVQLPESLRQFEAEARASGPDSRLHRYLRARSLTNLRERLTAMCDARLCIGGRRSGFEGEYAGVVEEALLALRAKKALYLVGFLSGAAEQVIRAISGDDPPSDPADRIQMNEIYADPPIARALGHVDGDAVWKEFGRAGRRGIARMNGLTEDENSELFETTVIDRIIQLVLTGLSRIRSS